MIVGVKDICYKEFLINFSLYEEKGRVNKYEELEIIIEPYTSAIFKELSIRDEIGKDATDLYNKIDDIYNMIDYLFLLKEEILTLYVCGGIADSKEVKDRFKYDCVRETMNCKYNLGSLFDKLAEKIAIPKDGRLGINYMTINEDECNIFKIHKIK